MCSTYELERDVLGEAGFPGLDAIDALAASVGKALIRRTDSAPVVTPAGRVEMMRWGFRRPQLGVVSNARAERLAHSAMWREAFAERRCLIPMTAFYEWSGPKGRKRTHRFVASEGGVLWAAGLWEVSSEDGPCFTMVTTGANQLMEPIHDRMPALMEERDFACFFAGRLSAWRPREDLLQVNDSANPLRTKQAEQGELF